MSSLQTALANEEAELNRLKASRDLAAATRRATQDLMQAASEELARASAAEAQSARVAAAALLQRRAELESQKASVEARVKDIEAAEKAVSEITHCDRELRDAIAAA